MPPFETIAAVDLGSNSFRLQVARVVDDQIYPLDALKDTVRLVAGLDEAGYLNDATIARATAALARFGERIRHLPSNVVRVVGTNTLRVAKNSATFLPQFEAALGFPIEIIAGREEARLIYVGAAHSLPSTREKRLVVDIGGGSTEFIIGSQYKPLKTESLFMGCVSYSLKYFPDGKISKEGLQAATLAARTELLAIAHEFHPSEWQHAIGTSGTARSLSDILELNDLSPSGITLAGLDKLQAIMLKAGRVDALSLNGLRADRAPVLPGGYAIMRAVFESLGIKHMSITLGALRDGVLYDLIGRHHQKDMRETTVTQFKRRYQVDLQQAERVSSLANHLLTQVMPSADEHDHQLVAWAGKLHEIGLSIAHTGYNKHTGYILEFADMPGFSRPEQQLLSRLALAHRGKLGKVSAFLEEPLRAAQVIALRLAVVFCRSRHQESLPVLQLSGTGKAFRLALSAEWVAANPLTQTALKLECDYWAAVAHQLNIDPI